MACIRAIEVQFALTINFPIIEDPSMASGYPNDIIDDHRTDAIARRSSYFIELK